MNINDIRRLYDYNIWANHLILDAVEKLSLEEQQRDTGISHQSIHGTLVHLVWAEWVWLARWKGSGPQAPPEYLSDIAALRERWTQVAEERAAFIAGLSEEALQANLNYADTKGNPHSLPLGLLMQHCANHSTLHRGQIMGMIRQLGITPPATDFLFYLYETMPLASADFSGWRRIH